MAPNNKLVSIGMAMAFSAGIFASCNDAEKTSTERVDTKMNSTEIKKDTPARKIDTTALPRPLKPGS